MRSFLGMSTSWLRARVLPLTLLAPLVGCVSFTNKTQFLGSGPDTAGIFCAIEKPSGRHCASADEKATGIRLAAAAEALVTGQTSTIGLDDSPAALARCNGEPEAVEFEGPFPQGTEFCLNCSAITPTTDATKPCQRICYSLTSPGPNDAPPAVVTSCAQRAHTATNFEPTACFEGACLSASEIDPTFIDPRQSPEPAVWQNLIGAATSGGNTLIRTALTTNSFDAGATSTQTIAQSDGYVEFTANELNTARLCGLSSGAPPDSNPTILDIEFAIDLFKDGHFYVFESGNKIIGPNPDQSFGAYSQGQKFRVRVKDNFDGTAVVTYSSLTAACVDGKPCPETVFYTSLGAAHYPLRVDASLREQTATIGNVRLVRVR